MRGALVRPRRGPSSEWAHFADGFYNYDYYADYESDYVDGKFFYDDGLTLEEIERRLASVTDYNLHCDTIRLLDEACIEVNLLQVRKGTRATLDLFYPRGLNLWSLK